MNIALIMPRSTFLEYPMVFQPLGLFYLAARLESIGHTTEFFDLNVDEIPEDRFDQIWVSATSPQMSEIKRIANVIQNYKSKNILGGASVWANPDACRNLGYDLIVGGEADSPAGIAQIMNSENDYEFIPVSRTLDWVLPPVRRWSRKYNSFLTDHEGNKVPCTTMFTSRGCPLECAFCIAEGQRVLMADGSWKEIQNIRVGDMVMGMYEKGSKKKAHGRIKPTRVLNVFDNGIRDVISISDEQSSLVLTPDHKVYANDGNKLRWKRADSTVENKYMFRKIYSIEIDDEFKRGWLSGYLAGDGCVHKRNNQTNITITSRDVDMLDLIQEWSADAGYDIFRRFKHQMGDSIFPTKLDSKYIDAVQCTSGKETDEFLYWVSATPMPTKSYMAGWLSGIYDADGTLDVGGSCRILQSYEVKPYNTNRIEQYLKFLGIQYNTQTRDGTNNYVIPSAVFNSFCHPMMIRKQPKEYGLTSLPQWRANKSKDAGTVHVYDIETECHSYIVEGFIVHNCESGRHGVIWDRMTRYEPLDIVEYQIKQAKELGYSALAYYDDILPLHKKRTQQIMELHRKYNMIWRCFLRSDIINNQGGYDYLKEMRDGGLVEIFVGVESADNEIKNNITKKTTIEQDTNIVQWCKQLGIRCKTSFILGLPGESQASMEKTRRWILQQRPDRVQVGRLIPFPGTPLFKNIQNYDIQMERNVDDDWFYMGHNDMTHSFVSTSHVSSKEIDEFWHKLNKELEELGIPR